MSQGASDNDLITQIRGRGVENSTSFTSEQIQARGYMGELETAEIIAENLRREPYYLFRNDCFTKSLRFRSECRKRGIKAHLV